MEPTKVIIMLVNEGDQTSYTQMAITIEVLAQAGDPKDLLWDSFLMTYRDATGREFNA